MSPSPHVGLQIRVAHMRQLILKATKTCGTLLTPSKVNLIWYHYKRTLEVNEYTSLNHHNNKHIIKPLTISISII